MTRKKFDKRDEPALVRAMHMGSLWAYQELVWRYTPRALKRAHFYAKRYRLQDHFEDLFSEFKLCVCVHMRRFDYNLGSSIPAFLECYFREAAQEMFGCEKFAVKIPIGGVKLITEIRKVSARLEAEGLPDDDASVAARTRSSERQVGLIRLLLHNPALKLDHPVYPLADEEEGSVLADVFVHMDPNTPCQLDIADYEMKRLKLHEILTTLGDRERRIIESRHLVRDPDDVATLERLGSQLRISRERVRQLEARSVEKLGEEIKKAVARKRETA